MAAVVSHDSVARVLPWHARPDVLARGGPAEFAATRGTAAHDAVAVIRAAQRRTVDGVRNPGRRRAGPVVAAVLPERGARRHEPAGGDRRASVPVDARARLVRAAPGASGRAHHRKPSRA